jgi:hypothetical protein
MDVSVQERRRAFTHWLRTGHLPLSRAPDGLELKFNPYHDPHNGQFTFAPGGSGSPGNAAVSTRRAPASGMLAAVKQSAVIDRGSTSRNTAVDEEQPQRSEAVYRPSNDAGRFEAVSLPRNPRASRASNSRAFQDPLTLAQTFPGLQDQPAGAIIALADNVLDFSGPARDLTADLTLTWSNTMIEQIKALDPNYRFDSLGFPETLQGQVNQLNALRFQRAAAFMRQRAELAPMQVETLRFVQESADEAYDRAIVLLRKGRLKINLSDQEAIGNYVDREVRRDLRARYGSFGINSAGKGPVRVNRREDDSSGSELSYRRPDARVGNVAYDVTLTQKTTKTPQVRGFFDTDFRPEYVIIIRPRQLPNGGSYIITRPEKSR